MGRGLTPLAAAGVPLRRLRLDDGAACDDGGLAACAAFTGLTSLRLSALRREAPFWAGLPWAPSHFIEWQLRLLGAGTSGGSGSGGKGTGCGGGKPCAGGSGAGWKPGAGGGPQGAPLARNTSLQRLVIDDAFLSDKALTEGLAVLPNLRQLELCACHWLGGGGCAGAAACPRLRSLALTQCNGIDREGLMHLSAIGSLASLEVVRCNRLRAHTVAALDDAFRAAHGRPLQIALLSADG